MLYQCCLLFALFREVARRVAPQWSEQIADRLTAWVSAPWAIIILAVPYFVTQLLQGDTYAGITSSSTLMPEPKGLFSYLTAFSVGWLIARNSEAVERVGNAWRRNSVIAVVTSFFVLLLSGMLLVDSPGGTWNIVLAAISAVSVWTWNYGLFGFCLENLSEERPRIRYLADASYWIYLMHLPLIVGIGALLTDLPVLAEIKLLVTIVVATAILILTYDLLVRSTWLGKWLNGRRNSRLIFRSRKGREESAQVEVCPSGVANPGVDKSHDPARVGWNAQFVGLPLP